MKPDIEKLTSEVLDCAIDWLYKTEVLEDYEYELDLSDVEALREQLKESTSDLRKAIWTLRRNSGF